MLRMPGLTSNLVAFAVGLLGLLLLLDLLRLPERLAPALGTLLRDFLVARRLQGLVLLVAEDAFVS